MTVSSLMAAGIVKNPRDGVKILGGGELTKTSDSDDNHDKKCVQYSIPYILNLKCITLEEMQKEGEEGRKKIAEFTRYLTVVLALIESVAMAVGFGRGGCNHNHCCKHSLGNCFTADKLLVQRSKILRKPGDNIDNQHNGNTVSDSLFRDLLTEPHQERGAGCKRYDRNECYPGIFE